MTDDTRREIVETEETKTALWAARPIPPPANLMFNVAPPEITLSREFLLEHLPATAQPATETGTVTDGPINVRGGPGTGYPVIGSLATGKAFTCYRDDKPVANGYTWRKLTGQQVAWIAEKFTSLAPVTVPVPPPPPPVQAKALIGIHVADTGTIGDFRGVIERAALTPYPVPGVVVVNDGGLVDFVKRTSPQTQTVFRGGVSGGDPSPFGPDGSGNGYAWVNTMWSSSHSGAPMATFHQMYNEVSFGGNMEGQPQALKETYARNVARTEIDMMKRANEMGIRLTLGNTTAGVPDPKVFGAALAPVWDFAQAHGHAALFHWYSTPGGRNMADGQEYMLARFLDYYKRWPKLQIVIGEMGLFDSPRWTGPQIWLDAAAILRPYARAGVKVWAASWTIKGQNDIKWRDDDYTAHLGAYETELKAGRLG